MPETVIDKAKEFLLDRDVFGEGFSFTLPNGKETTRTWGGTCLTFFFYIILLIYSYMKIMKVFGYGDSMII